MPSRPGRLAFEPLESRLVLASADSTVVFNEIAYHPPSGMEDLEWVELYNQMAVDMDLSGWRLDGGVDFEFAEGTILPGGQYLVVAADPDGLAQQTGFDQALGPYIGRLSNGGEEIILRNNSDRLMDAVDYNDRLPWPVDPDGSGTSLAKLDAMTPSGPAENWSSSYRVGGTAGQANFPDPLDSTETTLVALDASWKYEASGTDLAAAWRQPGFDDAGWNAAPAPFFAQTPAPKKAKDFSASAAVTADNYFAVYLGNADGTNLRLIGRDTIGDWQSIETFDLEAGANDHVYLAAWEAPGDSVSTQMVIGEITLPDDAKLGTNITDWQCVLGPSGANPGGSLADPPPAVDDLQTVIADANGSESWAAPQVQRDRLAGPWGGVVGASFSGTTKFIWADTFENNSATNINETFALFRSVEPLVPALGNTELPLGPTTDYFRTEFDFHDAPARTELLLDTIIDDGAVFYLNGVEVYRQNLPAGTVTYDTLASTPIDPPTFTNHIALPTDQLIQGTNVLAVEVHQAIADDPDMLFGGELTAIVWPDPEGFETGLVLNELSPGAATGFWLELANHGEVPIALGGHVIASSTGAEYVLPAGPLAPGAFLAVTQAELGFGAAAGDKLFLVTADRSVVLDGVEVTDSLQGRSPDGTGRWLYPDAPSPGAPNPFSFHEEVVINEIMYHHRPLEGPPGEPPQDSDEEWIELFNHSASAVDLTGWQLQGGIEYAFEPDTTIPAGGYLVVAEDAMVLRAKYPSIEIVGDYAQRLSNVDDHVVLCDEWGNPADEVHYFEGGRWPEFADGGGSSLELRDPDADNTVAEAWAASDEGSKSAWQTYTYRGVAQSSAVGPDGLWQEFVFGLLDEGVVLLDDVRVVENPDGAAIQLIQNGTFDWGTAYKWRLIGNHRHSAVVVDPEDPGNRVLRLVATGSTEHMHNHAETTLAGGRSIYNGRTYEISFRAKWITGSNQLNSRLYFNRLSRTTLVEQPALHGTPGAQNSAYQANVGPTYRQFRHHQPVPDPFEPVTVSAVAEDPDGVSAMTLWYSINGGAFDSAAMVDQGDGLYAGEIPGQPAATIVQFYVEGEDGPGAISTFPAAGPNSRALYKVDDGLAATNGLHNFRIIMTPADANWLHTDVNLMSNDPVGATVIYREQEVFYDVGVRLKGSERGRVTVPRLGFGVYFNADQLLRGVHRTVLIDRSHSTEFGQREMLINQTMNHAGGLPGEYNDLIQVIPPRLEHTGSAELQLARFGDVFLDSQFQNGSDGKLFEYELIYYPTSTNDGTREGLKRPQPDLVVGTSIRSLGDDKEAYRWNFIIQSNLAQDDYAPFIEFAEVFGSSGAAFYDRIDEVMDVDQWLRAFAVATLSGAGDNYCQGAQHNAQFYIRPEDQRMLYFPHDLDAFYQATRPVVGNNDLSKLIVVPANARLYYGHLYDIISTSYNGPYMSYWTDHYGSLLPGQDFPGYQSFIEQRSSYVLSAVMGFTPQVPFEITTNGGNDFSVDDVVATIEGNGWINVREIRLEGNLEPLEVTWTDRDSWRVTVLVAPGENPLTFRARDFQGNLVGTDTITVTSTIPERPLRESLRITELCYNPAPPTDAELAQGFGNNDDFEFIELRNIGPQTLDLTSVQFTEGIDFQFTGLLQAPLVLITEAGTGEPDYVEIHNVSGQPVDTSGWVVVVNDAYDIGHPPDINAWHSTLWTLPPSIDADEVLYRSDIDDHTGNYWGDAIFWRTDGNGWAMIIDDAGNVADFVVWGYDPAEIESLQVNVNGFEVSVAGAWDGASVPARGSSDNSLQRTGGSDQNGASDWAFRSPRSMGAANAGLTTPFVQEVLLDSGQFAVVARNTAAFRARYGPGIAVAGQYEARLANEGERILLADRLGRTILDFRYGDSDAAGWPDRADGRGASLELIDPAAVPLTDPQRTAYLEDGASWRSSSEYGGSPGTEGTGPAGDVVVNEVLSHTDPPLLDTIELHNATGVEIAIGGWYLSDSWGWESSEADGNYKKFRIPAGTTLPAYGYRVFDESQFNPFGGVDPELHPYDFALDGAHGDDVWLMEADASGKLVRFVDHAEFGAAAQGESWGRWPGATGDLYPMLTRTFDPQDGENSGPRIGPVIISELHYNPESGETDDDLEFVEIYNTTARTVDLTEWRIRGGISYDFPPAGLLEPYSALIVVGFEPSDADRLTAFHQKYWPGGPVPDDLVILGGYSGRLNDDGEWVQLQRPDEEPEDEPGFIPRLLEDEVRYGNQFPWPTDANGGGNSLHRAETDAWGNTAAGWESVLPTPGEAKFVPPDAQVVGRHIFYNNSRFDGNDASANANDDAAIAPDKQALLPGERATFANYTGYSRGINAVMIDVDGMAEGAVPDVDDFRFRVGNGDDANAWTVLSTVPTITVRPTQGLGGSDRVTLIWPDNTIQKQWLQVSVLATDTTALAEEDVFYFGNAPGESGNSTVDAKVNAFDMLGARDNQRTFLTPAPIDFAYDFNRDARVNTYDMLIARDNQTHFLNALKLITVPDAKGTNLLLVTAGSEAHPATPAAKRHNGEDAGRTGRASLSDVVLERVVGRESGSPKASSAKLDWLYEFDQMTTSERSPGGSGSAEEVLDMLLANS